MRLKFSNIGKISEADIELNGITVIAGNNDTGKSTVGKLLYATSTVLNVVTPEFLLQEKLEAIDKELFMLHLLINDENTNKLKDFKETINAASSVHQKINGKLEEASVIELENELNAIIYSIVNQLKEDAKPYEEERKKMLEPMWERLVIHAKRSIKDENLKKMVIQSIILAEFSDSLTSEFKKDELAKVVLTEDRNLAKLDFKNNRLQQANDFKENRPFARSFYIDTPLVLDNANRFFLRNTAASHKHRDKLLNWICRDKVGVNVFEEALIQEKTGKIFSNTIDGELKFSNRGFLYHSNKFSEPLEMGNVSAGIKSFAIIKLLMDTGGLEKCEFLILDEPEINLHPKWQLKYAELLVILQKHYRIRIVLTSHSPYFVEAMELYSQLHGIDKVVRFYKTEIDGKMSKIINVTNCIERLYEDMARPLRELEELEDELDGE